MLQSREESTLPDKEGTEARSRGSRLRVRAPCIILLLWLYDTAIFFPSSFALYSAAITQRHAVLSILER